MKSILLALPFLILSILAHGQNSHLKDVQYDEQTVQYCLVNVQFGLFSNKVTARIDYGQNIDHYGKYIIHPKSGEKRKFNSPIDVLNYMAKEGWKLAEAFKESDSHIRNVRTFLLKREVKD